MKIELVRLYSEEQSKIQLETGKHVIGRGEFIESSDDTRVSHDHAELEITDESISLKSLHSNPCYYIKKNISKTETLEQNESVSLNNGDKFGFTRDDFWFEVVFQTTSKPSKNIKERNEGNKEKTETISKKAESNNKKINKDIEGVINLIEDDDEGEQSNKVESTTVSSVKEDDSIELDDLFIQTDAEIVKEIIDDEKEKTSPESTSQKSTELVEVLIEPLTSEILALTKRSVDADDSTPVEVKKMKSDDKSEVKEPDESNSRKEGLPDIAQLI